MDKLQYVKQESDSDLLQLEPMTPDPDAPKQGKCIWILERGDEKGEVCNKTTFDGEIYCSAHLISNARREAKRLKRECSSKEESSKDISVTIKTSGSEPVVEIKEIISKPVIKIEEKIPLIEVAAPISKIHIVEAPAPKPILKESPPQSQSDILSIINNFSIAIVNLTEILRK